MTTTDLAGDASGLTFETMLSCRDQLTATTSLASHWIGTHPCPDPDIGCRITDLFDSYATVADTFEAAVQQPKSIILSDLGQRMTELGAMAVETLASFKLEKPGLS